MIANQIKLSYEIGYSALAIVLDDSRVNSTETICPDFHYSVVEESEGLEVPFITNEANNKELVIYEDDLDKANTF